MNEAKQMPNKQGHEADRMDDIQIPDEFLNYNDQGFSKINKKSGNYKKSAAKSGFVITINPNISHRTLTDINDRKRIFIQLTKLSNELEANFKQGMLLKEKPKVPFVNGKPPPVDKFQCVPEIGKQNGFIHLQGVVVFNGTTYIDLEAVREMIRNSPNGFGATRECKVQFKWFASNNEQTLLDYIKKDYERTTNNASNSTRPEIANAQENNNENSNNENSNNERIGNEREDVMRFKSWRSIASTNTLNNKIKTEIENQTTK